MNRILALGVIVASLLVLVGRAGPGAFEAPPAAEAAETTVELMYGNEAGGVITVGPANTPAEANEASMGIGPFCTDCYITKIVPDLVYWNDPNPLLTNGMSANFNQSNAQGVWLHHDAVVFGLGTPQCPITNIIVSGNERTVYEAPAGYGSYIPTPGGPEDPNGCLNFWFVNWHIHNDGTVNHSVRVKFTVTYRTGETLNRLKGVGFNIATAQNAEFTIGTGLSHRHTGEADPEIQANYVITPAQQGQIIAMGGHVHDYGFGVSVFNITRGQYLCTSLAGYGSGSRYLPSGGLGTPGHPAAANSQALDHDYHQQSTPDDAYHIQNMGLCNVSPSGSILCAGDVIQLHVQYNNASGFPITDAMAIMSAALPATPPDADSDGTWDGCDTGDFDSDEFSDRVEAISGTQANDACADNTSDDAWPADITNDRLVNFGDIGLLTSIFGQAVPPGPARRDIAPDPPNGLIDFGDIGRLTVKFGVSCTP